MLSLIVGVCFLMAKKQLKLVSLFMQFNSKFVPDCCQPEC